MDVRELEYRSGYAEIALESNCVIEYNQRTPIGETESVPDRATGCQGREADILVRFSVSLFSFIFKVPFIFSVPSRSRERNGDTNRRCSPTAAFGTTSDSKK